MNISLLDPFQNDFPEVIEEYLEHGIAKCIAFNRRGTLLAAGCSDGSCVIWDFHTRGVARELRDPNCTKAIANISWSKCGYHLLAASTDKTISCWDVARGVKIGTETLPHTALHAHLHPGRHRSKVCVACPVSHAPFLVNFESGEKYLLSISAKAREAGEQTGRGKASDTVGHSLSAACFNKAGDLIFLGNNAGEILIIDTETRQIRRSVQVQGGAAIRHIAFSRCGSYLLTVSSDRVIRVFENLLPRDNAAAALECESETKPGSVLNMVKEFQDSVNRPHWKTASFSNDSEYVVGASSSKSDHKICIWSREFGHLKKMLEGPKKGIMDLAWHPNRPLLASLAMSGVIYIWAKDYTENWSAFAPDFRELEENEEYVEREDEFDLNAETEKEKPLEVEEDAEVDITTTEKIAVFSDSESEDNLYFLPSIPEPDPEEPPPASPLKAEQTSHPSESNDSPVSEETNLPEPTVAVPQPESPPQEEEVGANGRAKRKRRLSEKAAELQAELGKKSRKPAKGKGAKGDEDDSEETLDDLPATKKQTRRQQKLKPVSSLPGENEETPAQS